VSEVKDRYEPEINGRFIRITRHDGTVLYRSGPPNEQNFNPADVPLSKPSSRREFARKENLPDGHLLVIAASRVAVDGGGSYLIEVGAPTAPIEAMLDRLLLLLGVGLPVVVLVAVGGGYFLVKRALTPVDKIGSKAELISQHNLSDRLPVTRTGDE